MDRGHPARRHRARVTKKLTQLPWNNGFWFWSIRNRMCCSSKATVCYLFFSPFSYESVYSICLSHSTYLILDLIFWDYLDFSCSCILLMYLGQYPDWRRIRLPKNSDLGTGCRHWIRLWVVNFQGELLCGSSCIMLELAFFKSVCMRRKCLWTVMGWT